MTVGYLPTFTCGSRTSSLSDSKVNIEWITETLPETSAITSFKRYPTDVKITYEIPDGRAWLEGDHQFIIDKLSHKNYCRYFSSEGKIWEVHTRNCGTDTSWFYDYSYEVSSPAPLSPEERRKQQFKQMIASRMAPAFIRRSNPLKVAADIREQRARETLRRVIGEEKFRRYLKSGFVSVRGRSGLVYQLFPGHGITAVFKEGKMVDRLCVVLRGDFPDTDSLIMRYLLILNNETKFRDLAIIHGVYDRQTRENPVLLPLVEDWRQKKLQQPLQSSLQKSFCA